MCYVDYIPRRPDTCRGVIDALKDWGANHRRDKIDHLRQLKQLLDEGILTNEEFNTQKAVREWEYSHTAAEN